MELEKIGLNLRPRSGWEAVDLGFRLAAHYCKPLWVMWFCMVVPLAVVLHVLFWNSLWVAILVLWWVKPILDRFLLYVLSQSIFGTVPGIGATLKDWRRVLAPGWFASLTWRRFDMARSYLLPVMVLEQQTGRAARQRRKVLGARLRGHAVGLTMLSLHFELALVLGFSVLIGFFLVPGSEVSLWEALMGPSGEVKQLWDWSDSLVVLLAMSLIEPFYVAAGFSLYLNRRVMIEAWDLELGLRKLARRLVSASALAVKAMVMVCISLTMFGLTTELQAQQKKPAEEIKKVLAAQEFGGEKQEMYWALRDLFPEKKEQKKTEPEWPWLKDLSQGIARVLQLLGWVILILVVLYLLRALWRAWPASTVEKNEPIPEQLFGMDITPESLPQDITRAALALAEQGRLRQALSLLYRGSLSALVYVCHLPIRHSDTEGDVMRHGKIRLSPSHYDYLQDLIRQWSWVAYAHRQLQAEQVVALAQRYPMDWNQGCHDEVVA